MSNHRRFTATSLALLLFAAASMAHYTVAPGDTLSEIAAEHGVTVTALSEANGITNADRIYVGQSLAIPGASDAPTSTSKVHFVAPGETLGVIAAMYGTTADAIAALNGITNQNIIYVGTQLRVSGTPVTTTPRVGTSEGSYVVQAGDTLSEIAAAHGVSTADLAAANALSNQHFLKIGQVLSVPGGSSFLCPVPGGTFFNDWGFPRSGGRYHEGNDIFAARGTPVVAPVSGFVHHIVGERGGNQFRLDGDDGNRYIGTHMDSFGASGQVRAGEVIGYVGDSGNAVGSSPHLHFEIHINGSPTNPYPLIESACN